MKPEIHWLGHASFRICGNNRTIYVDPYNIKNPVKADLILITHDHFDHCSPHDVDKIYGKESLIITVSSCIKKLQGKNVKIIKPGDRLKERDILIECVPSYNINKNFHPKTAGYVGFIIELEGKRIYHAGDTDLIPEFKEFKVDIALLPVSGTYVMDVDEAVKASEILKPSMVIPMHIAGGVIGSMEEAKEFARKVKVPVKILDIET